MEDYTYIFQQEVPEIGTFKFDGVSTCPKCFSAIDAIHFIDVSKFYQMPSELPEQHLPAYMGNPDFVIMPNSFTYNKCPHCKQELKINFSLRSNANTAPYTSNNPIDGTFTLNEDVDISDTILEQTDDWIFSFLIRQVSKFEFLKNDFGIKRTKLVTNILENYFDKKQKDDDEIFLNELGENHNIHPLQIKMSHSVMTAKIEEICLESMHYGMIREKYGRKGKIREFDSKLLASKGKSFVDLVKITQKIKNACVLHYKVIERELLNTKKALPMKTMDFLNIMREIGVAHAPASDVMPNNGIPYGDAHLGGQPFKIQIERDTVVYHLNQNNEVHDFSFFKKDAMKG